MRSCDGIFSGNFADGLLAQQQSTKSGLSLTHGRASSCFETFLAVRAKFIRLPLDNVSASSSRKFFRHVEDIHRSGGKLLDNTCLTSRVRGGSLHVGSIARSLITGPLLVARTAPNKKSRCARRFFAMATPTRAFASSKNHQTSKEAIAKDTHTSMDEVEKLYEQELTLLASEAKITQYLGVLTSKRVRMKLRKH
jgi:hypothetical protein